MVRRALKNATIAYGVTLGVVVAVSLVTCVRQSQVVLGVASDTDALGWRLRATLARHLDYLKEIR